MKVYIKVKELEYRDDGVTELGNMVLSKTFLYLKYRTMWALRSIEKEINEQGGVIIIREDGKIETRQFTTDLTEKINQLIGEEFYK